ncbi:MAG: helix-hairpin-helix domain-containing protein [Lachnospiraceae bacterium]|nr:helix-hairpin-helix domain-containing protein [Lachnospiraceae bacterium]
MKAKISVLVVTFIVFCAGFWFYEKGQKEQKAEFSIGNQYSETDKATDSVAGYDNQIDKEDTDGSIFAYICGEVSSPGVYELDSDSRIVDLLNLAGGFTEYAAEDYVNLAERVTDGMKVYVPTVEEAVNMPVWDSLNSESGIDAGDESVNINLADIDTLTSLPGIGNTKAEAIVSYREENGKFASKEEILNVNGIGESTYDKIKDLITVSD